MGSSLTVQPNEPEATAMMAAMLSHPSFILALRERRRQVEDLGFTGTFDATRQNRMQLSKGAACFLRQAILLTTQGAGAAPGQPFTDWPWAPEAWKPPHTVEEALVKAMALIAAELDRIHMGKVNETGTQRVDLPA